VDGSVGVWVLNSRMVSVRGGVFKEAGRDDHRLAAVAAATAPVSPAAMCVAARMSIVS
jgi:hypothetical protein